MTARFASNLIALIAGALLVSTALAFGDGTESWIALGLGCAAVLAAAGAFPLPGRGAGQRVIDVCIALAGVWTIVASRAFDGQALHWLAFSAGVGIAALGTVGLVLHESLLERTVHSASAIVGLQAQGDGQVPQIGTQPGAVRASR